MLPNQHNVSLFTKLLLLLVALLWLTGCKDQPANQPANQSLISVFPLENYDQQLSNWRRDDNIDAQKPLLSKEMEKQHLANFYKYYIGTKSPWDKAHISKILSLPAPDNVFVIEKDRLSRYDNKGQKKRLGYGENFRPYDKKWLANIEKNMQLQQFNALTYNPKNRAIAIQNLHARALPTDDVFFYSHQLAGEGYPFDNLQVSALWIGTPVYILGESKDRQWLLVLTADYTAWVKSKGILRTDARFINTWVQHAKRQLAAIIKPDISLLDNKQRLQAVASIGSFFPVKKVTAKNITLLVPVMNSKQQAGIKEITVSQKTATLMPLKATPMHFDKLMKRMLGRPYGWGNMYFYHDCSSELKSLFVPFAIWLPRHSSDQLKAGKMIDKSKASYEERLTYLMTHGKPYLSIVYVGAHVFLYMGNYTARTDTQSQVKVAMTYQNVWGLAPATRDRRAVIGKSVLLPLLLKYKEDPTLVTFLEKPVFKITFLDETPLHGNY
jgi:hypothetical protein